MEHNTTVVAPNSGWAPEFSSSNGQYGCKKGTMC